MVIEGQLINKSITNGMGLSLKHVNYRELYSSKQPLITEELEFFFFSFFFCNVCHHSTHLENPNLTWINYAGFWFDLGLIKQLNCVPYVYLLRLKPLRRVTQTDSDLFDYVSSSNFSVQFYLLSCLFVHTTPPGWRLCHSSRHREWLSTLLCSAKFALGNGWNGPKTEA